MLSFKKFFLIVTFFLISCNSLDKKGCYIDNFARNNIKEGVTYRDNVIEMLGEPSYKFDDNTFLYHSYFENTYGIVTTRSYNEQILLLYFNDDGYLIKKILKEEEISKFSYNKYRENKINNRESFFKDLVRDVDINIIQ